MEHTASQLCLDVGRPLTELERDPQERRDKRKI
jgi:hypothetical protein